ncbi:serine O-acetyltransferase [Williamsia serinedens]|uniref:serine O-acetyltransferase n=1 Tax=Williamsia serinedens TaxID=391736 RepID=UPI0020A2E158|nr:DapH/DapD/GlmU-related protein [Williamsia serinedens]
MLLVRVARACPIPLAAVIVDIALKVVCGVDIPRSAEIGPGLRLAHGGRGTVIHPRARIGERVTIYHGVTLGTRGDGTDDAPTIGDGAYIGAGACILGGVTVGRKARIGANAVVLTDIPDCATAVGVPARVTYADRSPDST